MHVVACGSVNIWVLERQRWPSLERSPGPSAATPSRQRPRETDAFRCRQRRKAGCAPITEPLCMPLGRPGKHNTVVKTVSHGTDQLKRDGRRSPLGPMYVLRVSDEDLPVLREILDAPCRGTCVTPSVDGGRLRARQLVPSIPPPSGQAQPEASALW